MREMCYNIGMLTFDPFLAHYGVKGMKWGVRKTPDRIRNVTFRRKSDRNRIEKGKEYTKYFFNKNGTIIVTDNWVNKEHPHRPLKYKPYAVVQTISGKHRQIDRTIYNGEAWIEKQIHGMGHNRDSAKPYGNGGAHAHDFKNQRRVVYPDGRHGRELTRKELREHGDIIGKRKP